MKSFEFGTKYFNINNCIFKIIIKIIKDSKNWFLPLSFSPLRKCGELV